MEYRRLRSDFEISIATNYLFGFGNESRTQTAKEDSLIKMPFFNVN
jgi:hypothetical protein